VRPPAPEPPGDRLQTTLDSSVTFSGTGLHTGRPVTMTLHPAPAGQGIVFRRTDAVTGDPCVKARWDRVMVSPLNTRIANEDGVSVSTIEHLMAALAGTGIHNASVAIDGPEVPVMDGSSADFARGLLAAGRRVLPESLHAIRILRPLEVREGPALARLAPATTLHIDFTIDFPDPAIGRQSRVLDLANGAFLRVLASSRTFCRQADVAAMRDRGLALGGTLDNAVVYDGDRVLSPGGLRHPDEAVRHKMLDALGDLATAGAPILGRYTGVRAGHALTNRLLHLLFASPDAWRLVRVDRQLLARLPGAGITASDLSAVA
jgi:UDP-3-O-[3-hydroxymyristoyl] N-acetylglucosamine deacetylase